jgi:hypothetical protein
MVTQTGKVKTRKESQLYSNDIVTCTWVGVTKITGSSPTDWIY